jgi:uncharacterized membrane-anchored protein YitT (DUF2179 family)
MNQIMPLLSQYHLPIMVGVFILLLLFSRKRRNKTLFTIALIALAASILYEIIWNEPVSRIPVRINQALNQPPPTKSTNPNYYAIPEEEKRVLDQN